jgi:heat shock protein HtpX
VPGKAMAAFGLYSHIQSNRRRSIALLIGLFLKLYVMVFSGALHYDVYLNCK